MNSIHPLGSMQRQHPLGWTLIVCLPICLHDSYQTNIGLVLRAIAAHGRMHSNSLFSQSWGAMNHPYASSASSYCRFDLQSHWDYLSQCSYYHSSCYYSIHLIFSQPYESNYYCYCCYSSSFSLYLLLHHLLILLPCFSHSIFSKLSASPVKSNLVWWFDSQRGNFRQFYKYWVHANSVSPRFSLWDLYAQIISQQLSCPWDYSILQCTHSSLWCCSVPWWDSCLISRNQHFSYFSIAYLSISACYAKIHAAP